jgi:hypothetical protein
MKFKALRKMRLNSLGRLFLILILGAYALATLPKDSFHQLIHAEEFVTLHSQQNESDPCHIRLYHENTAEGCHHDSHVSEKDTCSLGHIIPGEKHIVGLVWQNSEVVELSYIEGVVPLVYNQQDQAYWSSRAPPAV